MTLRSNIITATVGVVLILGASTYRSTLDHQSCADCRSFRYIKARSVFRIPISRSVWLDLAPTVPTGHRHKWWHYSRHTGSLVGTAFACAPHRFEDGTDQ